MMTSVSFEKLTGKFIRFAYASPIRFQYPADAPLQDPDQKLVSGTLIELFWMRLRIVP